MDNIYIEGLATPFDNTRTNIGVLVDGNDVSAFYNNISNINCNHIHEAYRVTTTGTVNASAQYFSNCSVFGDGTTDSTSIGYNFSGTVTGGGNGTTISGGYIEACAVGMDILANNGGISVFGTAFENADTDTDLKLASGVENCSFIGCVDLNRVAIRCKNLIN